MPVTATTFDALQIPLAGVQSINASAGTGKTFTITTLYLRYLLEAHCSVDQILVTTFTEAATAELKDRLRSRLSQTLALLREVEDEDEARELAADGRADSQIVELLQRVGVWAEERREWALERLEEAILSFDQAPVFTIHGFCGQVLKQLVFETGSRFNVELLTSQEPLLDEAVRDFVANSWTAEGSPLASWLPLDQGLWSVLHALAKQALEHPSYRVVPESADLAELFESPLMAEFETRASDFAAVWQSEREALRALIDAAQQKKWLSQSTHKPQQIDDGFGFIDSFARSPSPHAFEWGKDGKLPPVQRRLTQSELEKGTTGKDKHSRIPTHPAFTQYEELIEVASRLSEVIDQVRIRVLAQAAKFVREHVRQHKHEHGQMSFGDLLNHVDDALSGRFQLALQSSLRTRFRVAMVDEFQDTDPVQFRIFRRIFLDEPQSGAASPQSEISNLKSQRERSDDPFEIRAANVLLPSPPLGRGAGGEGRSLTSLSLQSPLTSTLSPAEKHRGEGEDTSDFRAFVMIGDPKQSIYKFRGADIDAYLDAIQQVPKDQRHEMGTNWRSDESLVNAVQALFGSSPDPFLSKSITLPTVTAHYPDRMSSGPALSITLVPRGDDVAPDEPLKNELALQAVVARLAADIVRLINDPVQIDDKHSDPREVQPGDLAVLARTGRQLRDIQQALAQRGVPAVLSLDESVFETAEAEHLSAVLQAVLNPGAASSMMNALRTPLFGLLASEIATLPANESALSDWAEQFQHWNSLWQHESFIVMWRRMLAEQEAIPRLAGLMLGERQITNFLHLGELLHQHAVTAHAGPDELLRWFNQTRAEPTDRDEIAQLRLETDADAVQLCTVHKSKGLEYPIVFCPVLYCCTSCCAMFTCRIMAVSFRASFIPKGTTLEAL